MTTQTDIAVFLQAVFNPFAPYLFFAFVVMTTFAILLGVRKLLVWGY